ncbi:DUF839 domain-containing protein [Methylicorpusculum oleiharenae]|uniref:alkaline phosphatase PhoX n=1 Tax=Methylicorpusculum oleiharenae TaxID=1338687 RepID=UPI0013573CFA|nr:alkaline phosphatase PhoX [Methylicorpusculum oleiharenae]MCD2450633.1 DUF839 domain-containing protein [Methylicorpusculum oleiharenae]
MKSIKLSLIASAVAIVLAPLSAHAAFDDFTPLANSVAAGSLPESAPFQFANPTWTQESIANRNAQLAAGQSNSGNWDMITANETGPDAGRYLFMPYETSAGGVQRIDLSTKTTTTIVNSGTAGFVAGDASRWTPWGSYLTAEESWNANGTSTKGRLFEITNPVNATGPSDVNFVHRSIIPRVSHEGLAFDKNNNLYFIDELNGGGIYKYTSANPLATNGNDFFAAGQTSVLKVGDGANANASGSFTWASITDLSGAALPGIPVTDGSVDGRLAQNVVPSTEYQRPEDLEIKTLENGNQMLFFAATTTDDVWTIDLENNNIFQFVTRDTLDEATGLAVGDSLNSPDNLAIDSKGNIYIIEDQGAGFADIWAARDENNDGVAESIGRWATLATLGAEPTGLYFDLFDENKAYVNVQHPTSGNDQTFMITAPAAVPVPGAVWLFGTGLLGLIARKRNKA